MQSKNPQDKGAKKTSSSMESKKGDNNLGNSNHVSSSL